MIVANLHIFGMDKSIYQQTNINFCNAKNTENLITKYARYVVVMRLFNM